MLIVKLMKKAILFSTLLFAFVSCLSQDINPNQAQVLVTIKGSDSSVLVNAIDLIGTWRNISSTLPIVGSNVPKAVIDISNGNIVTINDAWREDYPNKLKNCTWKIVDQHLEFRSPDLGRTTIEIEKLVNSNFFELTINTFTYRKLVNLSTNLN